SVAWYMRKPCPGAGMPARGTSRGRADGERRSACRVTGAGTRWVAARGGAGGKDYSPAYERGLTVVGFPRGDCAFRAGAGARRRVVRGRRDHRTAAGARGGRAPRGPWRASRVSGRVVVHGGNRLRSTRPRVLLVCCGIGGGRGWGGA